MSKRGENIYKRNDGRYEARYVKERDGNNKILKYGYVYAKTYKDAKLKKEKAIENIKDIGKLLEISKKQIFSIEIKKWFNAKIDIKESTYYNYYSIIYSRLIPFFSDIEVDNIDSSLILEFSKKLQDAGISNKRIKDILLVLKQFLNSLDINIKFLYPKQYRNKVVSLSDNDINKIIKHTLNSTDIKEFSILLVLYTGLRIGEICALQWKDIHLDKGLLEVSKTVVRVKSENETVNKTKILIDSPKTDTSIRTIPIHKQLVPLLKEFKKSPECFVLTGTTECLPTNIYYNFYKKFIKRINIEECNFHILRHTFATKALLNGIDIKTLSEILGHSSVKITLDRYVHITNDDKIYQINKLPFLEIK